MFALTDGGRWVQVGGFFPFSSQVQTCLAVIDSTQVCNINVDHRHAAVSVISGCCEMLIMASLSPSPALSCSDCACLATPSSRLVLMAYALNVVWLLLSR